MNTDLEATQWRKSSRSNQPTDNCVEVGFTNLGNIVGVRDSKDRNGPHLAVDAADWATFIRQAKAGTFTG